VSVLPAGVAPETLPLSRRLRAGTSAAHERVERTASFNRLIVVRLPDPLAGESAGVDRRRERARAEYREVYRRFLIAAHGFEQAVERRLVDSPALGEARATGLAIECPAGFELARDDLARVFGIAAAALPAMSDVPEAPTLAALAGIEYVRRGSRAGGALIGSVVSHNLGYTREHGATFLCRYGRETRSVLEAFRAWADGRREAIASAAATFHAVERWHRHLEGRFALERAG